MQRGLIVGVGLTLAAVCLAGAGRSEEEPTRHSSGRPLPRMPAVTGPVMFDTPEADRILERAAGIPGGQSVEPGRLEVAAASQLEEDRCQHRRQQAAALQPRHGLYPGAVHSEEGCGQDRRLSRRIGQGTVSAAGQRAHRRLAGSLQRSAKLRKLTLDDVQRDKLKENGDRHAIVVDPVGRKLYEFYQLRKTDTGWQAAQASIFDLKSNKLRPAGWTSADAAGLPIFPAVVRYDELKRGTIEHALRLTVVKTRRAYVAPATHYASRRTDPNLPRMGERLRLKKDFDVSGFSPEVQTILKALKKYGMLVADNGIDWACRSPRTSAFRACTRSCARSRGRRSRWWRSRSEHAPGFH